MAVKQNWERSKLAKYLKEDNWYHDTAIWILAGFDGSKMLKNDEINFYVHNTEWYATAKWEDALDPEAFEGSTQQERNDALRSMRAVLNGLQEYMPLSKWTLREITHDTPARFIDWAIGKDFAPGWLDWAVKNNLYKSKRRVEVLTKNRRTTPANTAQQITEANKDKTASQVGKIAAEARHSKEGGSRDLRDKIRKVWAQGNYSTRDYCAEEEYAGLGFNSFKTARNALVKTPKPSPWSAKNKRSR